MSNLLAELGAFYTRVAPLVGVLVGFLLAQGVEWLRRRHRQRAHWGALRAEMDFCQGLAETYRDADVAAPSYRLPIIMYSHSLPALLGDGAVNESEAKALMKFFSEVETLNRGLDLVQAAESETIRRRLAPSADATCSRFRDYSTFIGPHAKRLTAISEPTSVPRRGPKRSKHGGAASRAIRRTRMDVRDATERWNDLLLQTRLLWEACQKLRQEAEAATEVRGGSFATLNRVAGYTGALETGLRRAMDDVKTYRHGDKHPLTGEDWLRRMDQLLGPEEGSEPAT